MYTHAEANAFVRGSAGKWDPPMVIKETEVPGIISLKSFLEGLSRSGLVGSLWRGIVVDKGSTLSQRIFRVAPTLSGPVLVNSKLMELAPGDSLRVTHVQLALIKSKYVLVVKCRMEFFMIYEDSPETLPSPVVTQSFRHLESNGVGLVKSLFQKPKYVGSSGPSNDWRDRRRRQ